MSLELVLRTAVSGLMAQQQALHNTANNITNVNTVGYARTETQLQTKVVAGAGAGVQVGQVQRVSDKFLENELVRATGYASYYRAQADLHDRLQVLLGKPDSGTNLSARIDSMFAGFTKLSVDPSDLARRVDAVQQVKSMTDEISRLAGEVQNLRGEAERGIADKIGTVNTAIQQISRLNTEIARVGLQGADVTGLEQQRAQALDSISGIIDLRPVQQTDGSLFLYTASGSTLLDSRPRQLVYATTGEVAAGTDFAEITINRVGADGLPQATGEALYPALRSGSLKGLIDMRDSELPQIASMLGTLAGGIADQLNAVHNASSAVPAPEALTGRNVGALATDPHGFTGMATFASLDATGAIAAQVTIDFSTQVTLNDVVTAVNAGLAGSATLALNNGVMSFTSGIGGGVAIAQDATTPSDRAGRGFSDFFGMNDLVTSGAPGYLASGLSGGSGHGFGSTGQVSIELSGPGGAIAASHVLDFSSLGATTGAIVADLNTAFSGKASFALDGDGNLVATPAAGFESYGLHVASDTTDRGGTGVGFSDFFGFGSRFPAAAAGGLAVRSDILGDAGQLATARLDLTGTPALSETDATGSIAIEDLRSSLNSFAASGDLGAVNQTLGGYAAAVLSSISGEAARSDSLAQDREVLVSEISGRRDAVSGVNLDEELANMVLFQTAYNAAARMITTANQMYDTLLQIV